MTKFSIVVAVVLVVVPVFSAHAADADGDDDVLSTNKTKRPIEELFKTDVVYPEEKGELELELASVYQNRTDGDIYTLPISLEYGMTASWQVEAEWDSFVQHWMNNGKVVSGVGDLEVGTQYSFLNVDDSLFHIAPRFSVSVPLGDVNNDISDGFVEYEPAIILARDFPELHRTQVFTEIGASIVQRTRHPSDSDDAEPAANGLDFGAGFFTLFAHGAATFEFNCDNDTWNHHGQDNELYVTPGYLWRVSREVELGLGIPVGLDKGSDRFDISAHLVWEF